MLANREGKRPKRAATPTTAVRNTRSTFSTPNIGRIRALTPSAAATARSANPYGRGSKALGASAALTDFFGIGSAPRASPAIQLTLILPGRRTRACTTRPCTHSDPRAGGDLPMTDLV